MHALSTAPLADFWVVEGELDVPCALPLIKDQSESYWVFGGLDDPEGFAEILPTDAIRSTSSVIWSTSSPVLCRFRQLVRHDGNGPAIPRGLVFSEALCDYLTLVTGVPVSVAGPIQAYEEKTLRNCFSGVVDKYVMQQGGRPRDFQTIPPLNPKNLYAPIVGHDASESISWLRRALTTVQGTERFIFYYIALESIAKRLPGLSRKELECSKCKTETFPESLERAGIRTLLESLFGAEIGAKKGRDLASVRGKLAHGSADSETLVEVQKALPLLHRLVVNGISQVIGISQKLEIPDLNVSMIVANLSFDFDRERNPVARWGEFLTDRFEAAASSRGS